jgi:hypothetical protein
MQDRQGPPEERAGRRELGGRTGLLNEAITEVSRAGPEQMPAIFAALACLTTLVANRCLE